MQILTSPKNDYIRTFIQDVNRGRVVSVGTIANGETKTCDGPDIVAATPLAEAARLLTNHPDVSARVVTEKGHPFGERHAYKRCRGDGRAIGRWCCDIILLLKRANPHYFPRAIPAAREPVR